MQNRLLTLVGCALLGLILTGNACAGWFATPKSELSERGYQLILDFEVGGGAGYYNKFLKRPTVPPGYSGITVGIGYDLGYNTQQQILSDWVGKPYVGQLAAVAGLKQAAAKAKLRTVTAILITWEDAKGVFDATTVDRFYQLAQRTFPGFDELHPNTQAALVSLVFNRGSSMSGPSRIEMVRIRQAVQTQDYVTIASQLRKMKRLWPNIKGLLLRREAEAKLVENRY